MLTLILAALLLGDAAPCEGLPNSTGEVARLSVELAADGGAPALELLTEHLQPRNRAIVFYGPLPMDPVPWGEGELCIHPLYRSRGPTGIANALGRVAGTLDVATLAGGQTIYLQTLYRDRHGAAFNVSNLETVVLP